MVCAGINERVAYLTRAPSLSRYDRTAPYRVSDLAMIGSALDRTNTQSLKGRTKSRIRRNY